MLESLTFLVVYLIVTIDSPDLLLPSTQLLQFSLPPLPPSPPIPPSLPILPPSLPLTSLTFLVVYFIVTVDAPDFLLSGTDLLQFSLALLPTITKQNKRNVGAMCWRYVALCVGAMCFSVFINSLQYFFIQILFVNS